MEPSTPSLAQSPAPNSASAQALALAPSAAAGHFDELRGRAAPPALAVSAPLAEPGAAASTSLKAVAAKAMARPVAAPLHTTAQSPAAKPAAPPPTEPASLAAHWQDFFSALGPQGLGDLDQRFAHLQRQIRDNGVTYNVYADADGPQRPWALDLFPLLLSPADWAQIEAGVTQRARLLQAVMADVYGPHTLTRQALLPEALVRGHPGYLRPMQGVVPAGGAHLHIAAFDLARSPDGGWWVVSQRTQAPSGLGYLLENRQSISLQFPEAFQSMKVRRLAASYKALIDAMKAACPSLDGDHAGQEKRIVLLTPGPYNETYFEHAYLSRYLGISLVEGSDLLVRDERLYLRTIRGLEPVHGVLKRLDDEFLDPLELRSDSTLGVAGLLQVVRAGKVLMANAPGSAFLESPALLGFLPALSEHLLGEKLALPSLATWWCGEQAAVHAVLPKLRDCVIKPTYPRSHGESAIGRSLDRRGLDEWSGRILRRGEDHTVQAYMPLSQTPTWQAGRMSPRSAMLRVFALADGQGAWRVLPGGLARLAGNNENIASMQQGGSSADAWVLGQSAQEVQADRLARPAAPPVGHKPAVSSRSAENLYWLGRYTERADNSTRLAQLTLKALAGEDQDCQALLAWLSRLAISHGLVLPDVPPATQGRRVFERALMANLGDVALAPSVGFNLRALKQAAAAVRERLSQAQWQTVVQAEADFFARCAPITQAPLAGQAEVSASQALSALDSASQFLAALTGAQTDRMVRDDGWRLLSMGRLVERLSTLASALAASLETGAVHEDAGFRALLAFFDSTITFQAQYQQRRDLAALLDLLVLDRDNPRSLAWVVGSLDQRLAKLVPALEGDHSDLLRTLPEPGLGSLGALCRAAIDSAADTTALGEALRQASGSALNLSDLISQHFFSHAAGPSVSLGA